MDSENTLTPGRIEKPKENHGILDWKCKEYLGGEVHRLSECSKDSLGPDLKNISDIFVGLELAVPTMFGWAKASVFEVSGDGAFAQSENYIYPITFSHDDRECWTCSGSINKKAMNKWITNS